MLFLKAFIQILKLKILLDIQYREKIIKPSEFPANRAAQGQTDLNDVNGNQAVLTPVSSKNQAGTDKVSNVHNFNRVPLENNNINKYEGRIKE